VQTLKEWVRDELKRMSEEKTAPTQTGRGDEATMDQRLLDEAVSDFQEALDLARATRDSLTNKAELERLEAAGKTAEDEAISNMSRNGKPKRGPATTAAKRRRTVLLVRNSNLPN
jgi:uncharacterized protein (DUF305 family)